MGDEMQVVDFYELICGRGATKTIFEKKRSLADLYHEVVEPLMHSGSDIDHFSSENANLQAFKYLLQECDVNLDDKLLLSDICPSDYSPVTNRPSLRPFIFNMQGHHLDKAADQMSQIIVYRNAGHVNESARIKWKRKSA